MILEILTADCLASVSNTVIGLDEERYFLAQIVVYHSGRYWLRGSDTRTSGKNSPNPNEKSTVANCDARRACIFSVARLQIASKSCMWAS